MPFPSSTQAVPKHHHNRDASQNRDAQRGSSTGAAPKQHPNTPPLIARFTHSMQTPKLAFAWSA
eukprot:11178670-Lingulodinium_polyedra.AAC.1